MEALLKDGCETRDYARGDVLFSREACPRSLAFLLSGSALVYKRAGDGKRLLMNRLAPGDVFGMASLFCDAPYPVEVIAEHAARAFFIGRERLEAAFSAEPCLARNYIALLSERIHFLNRRIEALAGDDVRERLLSVLDGFANGDAFTLPYSLSQLAEMVGVGRASLYRALDELEREGVLSRDGRAIAGFKGHTQPRT